MEITALKRSPIKSAQQESIQSAKITHFWVEWDRILRIVNEKWECLTQRTHAQLFHLLWSTFDNSVITYSFEWEQVWILNANELRNSHFPVSFYHWSAQPELLFWHLLKDDSHDKALSDIFWEKVRLVNMSTENTTRCSAPHPTKWQDWTWLSFISKETNDFFVRWFWSVNFRENIEISKPNQFQFWEDDLFSKLIAIEGLEYTVWDLIKRCAMVNVDPKTWIPNSEILSWLKMNRNIRNSNKGPRPRAAMKLFPWPSQRSWKKFRSNELHVGDKIELVSPT